MRDTVSGAGQVAMRVGLVGCVKAKWPGSAPALDLYTKSALFRDRRRAVERTCDRWLILSAKHGLLEPNQVIEWYDEALSEASRAQRRRWSAEVLDQLREVFGGLAGLTFEIHAGKDYYDFGLEAGLQQAGANVEVPTRSLSMGHERAFYKEARQARDDPTNRAGILQSDGARGETTRDPPDEHPEPPKQGPPPPGGKYRPLYEHLLRLRRDRWDTSFSEIEGVLLASLPYSARTYEAWWANERRPNGHSHARAWLAAGFQTANVRLTGEHVTFMRVR